VGVDPLHLLSTVGSRIGQEAEDLLLVVCVLAHGSSSSRRLTIPGQCGAAKKLV
jgi:hypothetical protein